MRVCPECRKQYADDVEECPDDGNALLEADHLPANPELRDVVPVSPTDHTAMIDLEAIEAERERRGLNRPKETGPGQTAEVDAVDPDGDDEDEEEPHDPDATGTFHVDDLKGRERTQITSAGSLMADADDDELDEDERHPPAARSERTELTRRPRLDDPTMGRAAPRGQRPTAAKPGARGPKVLVAAIAGVVVVALGLAAGVWWYVSSRGAVLTVTSVPPGATVLLDGKEVGTAPLQDRVAIGSHVIELTLDGYRPFKEVVDVPAEGLPFLQPLEPDPDAKATPATTADGGPSAGEDTPAGDDVAGEDSPKGDAGPAPASPTAPPADELVAKFDGLLASADYDAALEAIKELVKHHPEDSRADALFERLADARIQAATSSKTRPQKAGKRKLSAEEKKRAAREAYASGEALYREGSVAEARAKLREAIQLDPRYPQPHRAIARIYERDGDLARTRYHLDRYLRLGGKDPDYRVRRWLEDHKDD